VGPQHDADLPQRGAWVGEQLDLRDRLISVAPYRGPGLGLTWMGTCDGEVPIVLHEVLVVGSDMVLWLSGLSVAMLLAGRLGVRFLVRNRQGRRSPKMAGSLTDLSEGFALVHALRVEITRLRDENQRLLEDRKDLLKVLSHVNEILEREARRYHAS
jgi:hypothetical protein